MGSACGGSGTTHGSARAWYSAPLAVPEVGHWSQPCGRAVRRAGRERRAIRRVVRSPTCAHRRGTARRSRRRRSLRSRSCARCASVGSMRVRDPAEQDGSRRPRSRARVSSAWLMQPRRTPTTSSTGTPSARARSACMRRRDSGTAQPPTPSTTTHVVTPRRARRTRRAADRASPRRRRARAARCGATAARSAYGLLVRSRAAAARCRARSASASSLRNASGASRTQPLATGFMPRRAHAARHERAQQRADTCVLPMPVSVPVTKTRARSFGARAGRGRRRRRRGSARRFLRRMRRRCHLAHRCAARWRRRDSQHHDAGAAPSGRTPCRARPRSTGRVVRQQQRRSRATTRRVPAATPARDLLARAHALLERERRARRAGATHGGTAASMTRHKRHPGDARRRGTSCARRRASGSRSPAGIQPCVIHAKNEPNSMRSG